jgi:hypothetical protein
VECPGAGKNLIITRMGMRQPTRLILQSGEVADVLTVISQMAHIPLLDGVFTAMLENLSVYAVVSEMVGSKFIIRKN